MTVEAKQYKQKDVSTHSRAATQDMVQKRDFRDQKWSKKGPLGTKNGQKRDQKGPQTVISQCKITLKYNVLMPLQNRNDTLFTAICTSAYNQCK